MPRPAALSLAERDDQSCSRSGAWGRPRWHTRPFYIRRHLDVEGRHSFQLPKLAGARRSLRDPDAVDAEHA